MLVVIGQTKRKLPENAVFFCQQEQAGPIDVAKQLRQSVYVAPRRNTSTKRSPFLLESRKVGEKTR
jgi:hypothetical protein